MNILWIYLVTVNTITFLLFGIDKFKAKRKLWRIPVAVLLLSSLIGGSLGGLIGMYLFRHKTRKPIFQFGLPAMLIAQIALIAYLYSKGVL